MKKFMFDNDFNIVYGLDKGLGGMVFTSYQDAFEWLCKNQDWTYERSDYHNVWNRGLILAKAILRNMRVEEPLRSELIAIKNKYERRVHV